jgi:hypothetical protein
MSIIPKKPYVEVEVDGQLYYARRLPIDAAEEVEAAHKAMADGTYDNANGVRDMVRVIARSLQRTHPDFDAALLSSKLDHIELTELFTQIANLSTLSLGEAPAVSEPKTLTSSS